VYTVVHLAQQETLLFVVQQLYILDLNPVEFGIEFGNYIQERCKNQCEGLSAETLASVPQTVIDEADNQCEKRNVYCVIDMREHIGYKIF